MIKAIKDNGFYGNPRTAKIDATYHNGKFINNETGEPIRLKEYKFSKGIPVDVTVPLEVIDESEIDLHTSHETMALLDRNDELNFEIRSEDYGVVKFNITLLEKLMLYKVGNKLSKLMPCGCKVSNDKTPEIFEAYSLNNAYTIASNKFQTERISHTCNVFRIIYHGINKLGLLRDKAELEFEKENNRSVSLQSNRFK